MMASVVINNALATAAAMLQSGKVAQAEAICQEVIRQRPDWAEALHLQGLVCFKAGRELEALTLLERAIRLKPEVVDFHCNLANVLLRLRRYPAAVLSLERAAELRPADAKIQL